MLVPDPSGQAVRPWKWGCWAMILAPEQSPRGPQRALAASPGHGVKEYEPLREGELEGPAASCLAPSPTPPPPGPGHCPVCPPPRHTSRRAWGAVWPCWGVGALKGLEVAPRGQHTGRVAVEDFAVLWACPSGPQERE